MSAPNPPSRQSLEPSITQEQRIASLLGRPAAGTHRVEPPSALLSKVVAFLPQIANANREIEETVARDPAAAERFNLESLSDKDGPSIEMKLGLGVYEVADGAAGTLSAAQHVLPDHHVLEGLVDSDEEEEDSSSDDDEDETNDSEAAERISAVLDFGLGAQKDGRPKIEVIGRSPAKASKDKGEDTKSRDEESSSSDEDDHEEPNEE